MLVRLFVLGLLMRRPMTGYEIQIFLQVNQAQQWANVLPGSIYHALKKLADEGLVVLKATEHAGNRSRAIYAITEAGQEELRRLLREAWRAAGLHFPSELYAALSFLDDLPREEVLRAIDERIGALERELVNWNAGESPKLESAPEVMHGYLRALFVNGREHMESDLRFLRQLRELLPDVPWLNWEIPDESVMMRAADTAEGEG